METTIISFNEVPQVNFILPGWTQKNDVTIKKVTFPNDPDQIEVYHFSRYRNYMKVIFNKDISHGLIASQFDSSDFLEAIENVDFRNKAKELIEIIEVISSEVV